MKLVALFASVVGVICSEEVVDESGVSLLQHSVRTIRKVEEAVEDPPGPPPPGVAERIAARRERRRAERAAGRDPSNLSPEQIERRRARRRAKRQAKKAAQAAGAAHFNDGGSCDTCAAKCTAIFNDEFKDCVIREGCRPWLKEDGAAADKCNKRCDRSGNWLREPCIRACQCDIDLLGRDARITKKANKKSEWAEGHHRCRSAPLGTVSTCNGIATHENTPQYDSIKKCAKAAVQAGANTFNFYRTSKEWAKCNLVQCTGGDLKLEHSGPMGEAPAGRGTWKVFSTFCDAPPVDQRSDTGSDESSR
jgi:hypothetical protein